MFVGRIWGEKAGRTTEQMVPYEIGHGLERDRCLSHLAVLQGYRPEHIDLRLEGDKLPKALAQHMRTAAAGAFRVHV